MLLGLALLVRLPLLPYYGFFHDIRFYVDWGMWSHTHFLDFYSYGDTQVRPPAYPNYPPLAIYTYGIIMGAYQLGAHILNIQPVYDIHQAALLDALIKLPTLLSDLASVALVYAVARRHLSGWWPEVLAASYAFSPAVLWVGPLWGQTDSVMALGIVLALLLALRGHGASAGIAFALAVLYKPQLVLLLVPLLLYLWRWQGVRQALRGVLGMCAAGLVVCLPYLLPPRVQMLVFVGNELTVTRVQPLASFNAFNVWWLLGIGYTDHTRPVLGALSPLLIGWVLFACVLLVALACIWRDGSPSRLFLACGLVVVAAFALTTLQHERYLFPALLVFLFATIYDRRLWPLYAGATLICFLNVFLTVQGLVRDIAPLLVVERPTLPQYVTQGQFVSVGTLALLLAADVVCVWSALRWRWRWPWGAPEARPAEATPMLWRAEYAEQPDAAALDAPRAAWLDCSRGVGAPSGYAGSGGGPHES